MARTPGGTLSAFTLLSTPDEPTITSVTTSIGSASVAFTAPTDVGDAAVSSYVVTAVDESSGASTGATGSASPITVTPPAGGTFKIRMQALNAYGPGRLTEYDTGNEIYSGAQLWAWGDNKDFGVLGDNTVINRSSPVQIGALTTWKQTTSGPRAAAAIKTDGTMWVWGINSQGQVGDGTVVHRSSPVQIGALTTWSQVSAGLNFCSAVKTDSSLWSWGGNQAGQLGTGTVVYRSSPVQIGALTTWSQVATGFHCAAVKIDGTLWTWGFNDKGQLGSNTIVARSSPVQVGSLTTWARVACGNYHTIAVKNDGTMWSWGQNNYGQLADNTAINRSSPVQVGALTSWYKIASGERHNASVKTDGTLWMWGSNSRGQIGVLTVSVGAKVSSPVQVGSLTDWLQGACAGSFSAAIRTNGTLWTWGYNNRGQLGQNDISIGGDGALRSSPVQVGALTEWAFVAIGSESATSGGQVFALYGVV